MELLALMTGDEVIKTPELRDRAQHRSTIIYTHHYVVREEARELAFLSLDFEPQNRRLVIYELLVPEDLRSRGIGTRILHVVDKFAADRGYKEVLLHVLSPEKGGDPGLRAWYEKRGYKWQDDGNDTMIKSI